jgi:hypothetical protein
VKPLVIGKRYTLPFPATFFTGHYLKASNACEAGRIREASRTQLI